MLIRRLRLLEKNRSFWLVLWSFVGFFLLRFPSLFEPNWYGDEGIYQVIGNALNHGRLLYQGIWDNKPPLLYILYAFVHANQFAIRSLSLLFGLCATGFFFLLAKRLLHDKKSATLSLVLFTILFGTPLLEGNIANAENFMLLPVIAAGCLVLRFVSQKKRNGLIYSGLLLSAAFLFKIVGLFDFTAFALFLVITHATDISLTRRTLKTFILTSLQYIKPLLVGFFLPIVIVVLFFTLRGALSAFVTSIFVQNVSYVNYGNTFIIPQGLLIFKTLVLSCAVLFLFWKRKNISFETLFILLWLSFSIFNALFSQRPYTHYLLVLLPSFCLFVGLLFEQKKRRKIMLVVLLLLFIFLSRMFSVYGYQKTFVYYQTFFSYLMGQKTRLAYQNFFDHNTPRDYALAQYVAMHAKSTDTLFVWGNNAALYALTNKLPPGRYIVEYHIMGSKESIVETYNDLRHVRPRFVVVMPNVPQMPYSLVGYQHKITLDDAQIYERSY